MKNDRHILPSNYLAVDGQKIWFVSNGSGFWGLYEMDLRNDKVHCLGELPIQYEDVEPYAAIGKLGDLLVIAPRFFKNSSFFLEYDLSKNTFKKTYINIPYEYIEAMDAKVGFSDAVVYNDSIFFIGTANGMIVEYQYLNKQYIFHDFWQDELKKIIAREKLSFQRHGFVIVGDELYLVPVFSNLILEIKITDWIITTYDIPYDFSALQISGDGDGFYILSYDSPEVVLWKKKNNFFKKVLLDRKKNIDNPCFYSCFEFNNHEVYMPCRGEQVIVADKDDIKYFDVATYFNESESQVVNDNAKEHFFLVQDTGERVFTYHLWSGFLYEFNRITKKINRHEQYIIRGSETIHYMKSCTRRNVVCVVYEDEDVSLNSLCSVIQQHDNKELLDSSDVGKMIYDKVLERCYE